MENELSIAALDATENMLDEFHVKIYHYLFYKISSSRYMKKLEADPVLMSRLDKMLEDEVAIRTEIAQKKALLQDISQLEYEIRQLASDESVLQKRARELEQRQKLLDSYKPNSK